MPARPEAPSSIRRVRRKTRSTVIPTADEPSESITVQSIDLVLAKTVDDSTPNEGATVTYTVQLTNNGPDAATTIVVTDIVPAGLTYVGASITGGDSSDDSDPAGAGLSWTVNTLANGASTSLTFQATVDAGTAGSTIVNTSSKTQDQVDSDTTADDPSESITVESIDLVLAKTVDNSTPNEGATVTYTVQLTNNGPDAATNVVVTDIVPAGLTYVAGASITGGDSSDDSDPAGAGLSWTVNTLANGASTSLTFQATVDAGTAGSTIVNTSSKTQDQVDSDSTADDPSESITVRKHRLWCWPRRSTIPHRMKAPP